MARKCASEYYEDTEKYTGDPGTETNPWTITNIDELDISDLSGLTANQWYFILTNDIDFNDSVDYKYAVTKKLMNGAKARLNGQGFTIYNMIYTDECENTILYLFTLRNTNFVNLIMKKVSNSPILAQTVENCNFGIYCNLSGISGYVYSFNFGSNISKCTFNIKGHISASNAIYWQGNTRYTNINLDIKYSNTQTSNSNPTFIFLRGSITDTVIRGNIQYTSVLEPTKIYITSGASTFTNSYIDLHLSLPNIVYTSTVAVGGISDGVSFMVNNPIIDKEGNKIYVSSEDTSLLILEPSQAKDATYLQDIGFITV